MCVLCLTWNAFYFLTALIGHCNVPNKYRRDRPLGRWAAKMRDLYCYDQLDTDRRKALSDIGFVWKPSIVEQGAAKPAPTSNEAVKEEASGKAPGTSGKAVKEEVSGKAPVPSGNEASTPTRNPSGDESDEHGDDYV